MYTKQKKMRIEDQVSIDLRFMKQQGFLNNRVNRGTLRWSDKNRRVLGHLDLLVEDSSMVLNYYNVFQGNSNPVRQYIKFDWIHCHYGGRRAYFLCPRCNRRVMILYAVRSYFYCRHCNNLSHSSQQEREMIRLLWKSQKIRKFLHADLNIERPIIHKPKNMHYKTFSNLIEKEEAISTKILEYLYLELNK